MPRRRVSVLWAPATAVFTTAGKPSSRGGSRPPRPASQRPAPRRQGCRRPRAARGSRPARAIGRARATARRRRARAPPHDRSCRGSGTAPTGLRSHSPRAAARPSARAADSGYVNAATPASREAGAGCPRALHHGREHGLLRAALRCACDRERHLVGSRRDRRDEEHDARRRRRDRRAAPAAPPRRSRPWPTRACRPDSRRSPRPAAARASARRRLVGERRKLQPRGLARVGAEDPEAAGVREDGDAPAARQRLRGEQHRDVDELLERLGPDHACLAEERVDRGVRARERGRVRPRGRAPAAVAPALEREDRLRARDAARDARELARVAERLEVEDDQARSRRRPPTTRAGRSTRRPPCCRSRRTPRARGRATRPPRAPRARARRSATRSRSSPTAAPSPRRSR